MLTVSESLINNSGLTYSNFNCTQTSTTQVSCTIQLDDAHGTTDLRIDANDVAGNPGTDTQVGYSIDKTPPTITHDTLASITAANAGSYPVTGTCTEDTDAIAVVLSDGATTTAPANTTCSSGTFSVNIDASALNDASVDVTSTIDDSLYPVVADIDLVAKDVALPAITHNTLVSVTAANVAAYPVAGTCSAVNDSISVVLDDGSQFTSPVATTCQAGGVFNVAIDASSLSDSSVTATSTIDDGVNPSVNDIDVVTKDATPPTITIDSLVRHYDLK